MLYIYILELEEKKYYVGKTTNLQDRLDKHFKNKGCKWTKIYKPIDVYEVISHCDSFDEDKITLRCMDLFGIENVRGGSFCNPDLKDYEIKIINKMLNTSLNKCFICGSLLHFSNKCDKK